MKGLKRLFNELLRTTGIYPPRDTAARFLQAIKNNDVAAIQHTLKQHPTATRWLLTDPEKPRAPADIGIFTGIKNNALGAVDAMLLHDPELIHLRDQAIEKNSVLHHGAAASRAMTMLLMHHHADINAVNAIGETPVMWARDDDEANVILDRNPDLSLKDREGRDAIFPLSRRGLAQAVRNIVKKSPIPHLLEYAGPALTAVFQKISLFPRPEIACFDVAYALMPYAPAVHAETPFLKDVFDKACRIVGHPLTPLLQEGLKAAPVYQPVI